MLRSLCACLLVLVFATASFADDIAPNTRPLPARSRSAGTPPTSLTENTAPASDEKSVEAAPNGRKVNYQQPNWNNGPSLSSVLFKMAFGTVIVLAACAGSLWYGRKWLQKAQGVLPVRGGELRLLESTRIGGQCFVHLLQVGNQRILAGTDRSGLQSLIPLPEAFGAVLDDAVNPARNEEPLVVDPFFGAHERGRLKTEVKPRATAMSLG